MHHSSVEVEKPVEGGLLGWTRLCDGRLFIVDFIPHAQGSRNQSFGRHTTTLYIRNIRDYPVFPLLLMLGLLLNIALGHYFIYCINEVPVCLFISVRRLDDQLSRMVLRRSHIDEKAWLPGWIYLYRRDFRKRTSVHHHYPYKLNPGAQM